MGMGAVFLSYKGGISNMRYTLNKKIGRVALVFTLRNAILGSH
jgi:hypothetical protein